jgi:polyphosphate kinase
MDDAGDPLHDPITPPEAAFDLSNPKLYLNRELSWLEFNQRVLAEALDPRNPLLERVKFLAITASNLDEFYAKRVGWLKRGIDSDPRSRTIDDLTVSEQLDLVTERCHVMQRDMERCWSDVLGPELAALGIRVVQMPELDAAARERITAYFISAIFPVLTPLVVDPSHPFPFISGGTLSLALNLRDPSTGVDRFARVKVPQNRPRFVDAGEYRFVLIEDLIAAHLGMLFPGMEVTECEALRVLRSADIGSPGEEAGDLLELIESELRRRRLAQAVSLELTEGLGAARVELLLEELELGESDIFTARGFLGLADLFQIAGLPFPALTDAPFAPAVPSAFAGVADPFPLFAAIRERDILVHHPYESFDATVARLVEAAANDPSVLAIKQTMYRTSPDSPILGALIDAAGHGKQVAVLVELTARFDEANNIEWARRLEDAGVHVAYGDATVKVHSKICLIVREEHDGVRLYGHIGTGNYNSRTARVYTDLGLFTADPEVCSDLVAVFNHLTGFGLRPVTKELLIAPSNLRSEIRRRIVREMENARRGLPARVAFKMNALEDQEMTRLLYEASQAGVVVDLVIRGICRLRPGIRGLSENVRVVSVIGRFLEHSRIYHFANGGNPEYFIGSADLMKRNLDERIEVVAPVRQPDLQSRLADIFETLLNDRRQGWRLFDSTWSRNPEVSEPGTHAVLLSAAPFS